MVDLPNEDRPTAEEGDRRAFLSASSIAMAGGLAAGYGTFFVMAGRYLYPAGDAPRAWMFVAELDAIQAGDSLEYKAPTGEQIVIARQGDQGTVEDFIALSSTCPHLGCQVDWQPEKNRFFCPCHNGVFDPQGKGTEGPPAAAGQSLPRYELRIEGRLLYIEVPTETVVDPWERRMADAGGRQTARGARLADRGAGSHRQGEEA